MTLKVTILTFSNNYFVFECYFVYIYKFNVYLKISQLQLYCNLFKDSNLQILTGC